MTIRLCKIALVAAVALFFALNVYSSFTDFDNHWQMVTRILTMVDTEAPELQWRAVTDPEIVRYSFLTMIGSQALTAMLCTLGALRLLVALFASDASFNQAKGMAVLGLTLGFLFYAVGVVTVAGEWFAMAESNVWSHAAVARLLAFIGATLVIVIMKDERVVQDIYAMGR